MKLLIISFVAPLLASYAQAAPVERATCTTKLQRKAWHTLSRHEKLAYINAEKCLMTLPPRLNLPGSRTLFDEFQKVHILQTPDVHFVGAFLPFHRYFMHAHEHVLRTACNYTGAQPYWDESIDAGNFTASPVLDPETGFGGNGSKSDGCITDGPFKDYVNPYGPGDVVNSHCIDRRVDECMSALAGKKYVDECMVTQNFSSFWPCVEWAPHSAGHGGIGAQMLNVFSSPGDPVFYLHHTYLDKLWWDWQSQSLPSRLLDITGRNVGLNMTLPPGAFPPNGTFPGFPPNGTTPGLPSGPGSGSCGSFPGGPFPIFPPAGLGKLQKRDGDPANVTTLSHIITVNGILPNITVGDLMDIQGKVLCYEYV